MMGGGTTLHEAIRLGANVIGYDLDPIPVLQARASLQSIPLEEKQQVFDVFVRALESRLRPYFQTNCPTCGERSEVQFVLYGARRSCSCGEALVIDSFMLREEPSGEHVFIQDFYPNFKVKRERKCWRLFEKAKAECGKCGKPLANCMDIAFGQRYVPLITVGCCAKHGQFFKAVGQEDLRAIKKARAVAARVTLPEENTLEVVPGPKSGDLLSKNITNYAELFTPRQILYLTSAKELLDQIATQHRVWLALLVSTSLEFNSILTGYKGSDKRRAGAIRHVFSHHAYSFPYTSLESNPVFSQKTSGTLRRLFEDRVEDAGEWAAAPIERQPTGVGWRKVTVLGETDSGLQSRNVSEFAGKTRRFIVEQRDSSKMPLPDRSVDFVVTDPPYFDSVQYSDLSHFPCLAAMVLTGRGGLAVCARFVCSGRNRKRSGKIPESLGCDFQRGQPRSQTTPRASYFHLPPLAGRCVDSTHIGFEIGTVQVGEHPYSAFRKSDLCPYSSVECFAT